MFLRDTFYTEDMLKKEDITSLEVDDIKDILAKKVNDAL